MLFRSLISLALALPLTAQSALAQTELTVQYAYPSHQAFHRAVADAFTANHPGVMITFRAAAPDYDEALQTVLRQSITTDLPDVFISGLQKIPDLVSRKIAVPLTPFTAGQDLAGLGYSDRLLSLGQVNNVQYALAYATSTPIVFFNTDLVKAAGGDPGRLPTDWDGLIKLAHSITALGGGIDGMYYDVGTDDWMFQNLIFNQGGELMSADGKDIAFDGAQGKAAMRLFKRFFTEGGQKAIEQRAARQQFAAGTLGIYFTSPSIISTFEKQIGGKFVMRTSTMPLANPQRAGVPTGGMAAVIVTTDHEKQKAAWDYIKFASGPVGQTIVAKATGYMPANTRALEATYLGDFFKQNPNWETSSRQIPIARKWAAWPGQNGVKIARNLVDNMTRIAGGADAEETLAAMARETRALLPK
ncbi:MULTISPECIES: ABC transporter substrate-binding protein [unclassified Neorhizobium]|uniref:ABC transporter substrate-binding protein n=1 Tax=unclassified Neorhizobium TaxID=2629175 RepID=UPI001FF5206F|nr:MULTISPECIES: ABC transporter substrate-binding protein [unclassified Neorhizobium]MCJ9668999.1 ABC transporter substrate-binding protein [Neorhizobium sp. SHOUNA12B]MCJ9744953.1 ABC transporter substrate-binding protein [Neorhizobium sp. SHOUNA12A]